MATPQSLERARLIERLSAATDGSRELDALIWLRLNRPDYSGDVKALEMRGWYDGRGHLILETEAGEEVADGLGIAPVTKSLDAALALAERVGLEASAILHEAWRTMSAKHRLHTNLYCGTSYASEAALHACIAILKALQAQENPTP